MFSTVVFSLLVTLFDFIWKNGPMRSDGKRLSLNVFITLISILFSICYFLKFLWEANISLLENEEDVVINPYISYGLMLLLNEKLTF